MSDDRRIEHHDPLLAALMVDRLLAAMVDGSGKAVPPKGVRKARLFGRNDRCHCGSGRKYKRCCLRSDLT